MRLTSNEQQTIVDALRDRADAQKADGNEDAHNGRHEDALGRWARATQLNELALRILRADRVEVIR